MSPQHEPRHDVSPSPRSRPACMAGSGPAVSWLCPPGKYSAGRGLQLRPDRRPHLTRPARAPTRRQTMSWHRPTPSVERSPRLSSRRLCRDRSRPVSPIVSDPWTHRIMRHHALSWLGSLPRGPEWPVAGLAACRRSLTTAGTEVLSGYAVTQACRCRGVRSEIRPGKWGYLLWSERRAAPTSQSRNQQPLHRRTNGT
jgi:hypothetical protein